MKDFTNKGGKGQEKTRVKGLPRGAEANREKWTVNLPERGKRKDKSTFT